MNLPDEYGLGLPYPKNSCAWAITWPLIPNVLNLNDMSHLAGLPQAALLAGAFKLMDINESMSKCMGIN